MLQEEQVSQQRHTGVAQPGRGETVATPVLIELMAYKREEEAAGRWQDLEQSLNNTGLTNSWTWIKTWLDIYGEVVEPTFAFGIQHGQVMGAALITKATHKMSGLPIPAVHLGTAGEPREETTAVEYNQLLVAPEKLEGFALALVEALKQRFRWSQFRLNGFVPEHAEALMRGGSKIDLQFQVKERESPAFDFQKAANEGHKEVVAALGSSTRYNIRRSLRLFESKFGAQQIEWAETSEQARDIVSELIELHQKRWEQVKEPGAFQSERVKRYHNALIDALKLWVGEKGALKGSDLAGSRKHEQGSLLIFRLKYGETTVGCLFSFVDKHGRVMFYKCGLPLFDDNKLKPGLVTHAVCMEECKLRGLRVYDFLAGDAIYKDQLSNVDEKLIWATAGRGPRAWLIDTAKQVRDMLAQR